jgi:hypothetical protein
MLMLGKQKENYSESNTGKASQNGVRAILEVGLLP